MTHSGDAHDERSVFHFVAVDIVDVVTKLS
jgi:hypothetical protein